MSDYKEMTDQLYKTLFSEFTKIAFLHPDTGKPCPCKPINSLERVIAAHVAGKKVPPVEVADKFGKRFSGYFRIGVYTPDQLGHSKFGAIDFDGGNKHSHPLKNPFSNAALVKSKAEALGIPSYYEVSGSGNGVHLWFFFEPFTSASSVRRLLFSLIENEKFELVNGSFANPNQNQGVEVFPKADRVSSGAYGNLIWLPWWYGANVNCCQFMEVLNGVA